MRAVDPEVKDAMWQAAECHIPRPVVSHPLGCHRMRAPDRICFEGIMIRLATGCSWEDAERLLDNQVSDTTMRSRRDEWIEAGVFELLVHEAQESYDRIIGLDLSETAVDGSLHKSPCGGAGTGKNPTDRAKLGWKWSILTDRNGIPIGWAIDGAKAHDVRMFAPPLMQSASGACSSTSRRCISTAATTARASGRAASSVSSKTSSSLARKSVGGRTRR
jgi:transposase